MPGAAADNFLVWQFLSPAAAPARQPGRADLPEEDLRRGSRGDAAGSKMGRAGREREREKRGGINRRRGVGETSAQEEEEKVAGWRGGNTNKGGAALAAAGSGGVPTRGRRSPGCTPPGCCLRLAVSSPSCAQPCDAGWKRDDGGGIIIIIMIHGGSCRSFCSCSAVSRWSGPL